MFEAGEDPTKLYYVVTKAFVYETYKALARVQELELRLKACEESKDK